VASDVIETAEEVADTIGKALQFVSKERLFPCTNCGMAPMGRDVAWKNCKRWPKGQSLRGREWELESISNFRLKCWKSNHEVTAMPEIRMRSKNQFTLPASVVRESGIQIDDKLSVMCVNGSIVITPLANKKHGVDGVMGFAGIAQGVWGDSPEEVEQTLRNDRATWQR
jgi:antitoxin component of MazEF toxin-antitoxin module